MPLNDVHHVSHFRMTQVREWHDKRDDTYWMLWLRRGDRPVLVCAAEEGERYSVNVDFQDGLDEKSDRALEELLDGARSGGGSI